MATIASVGGIDGLLDQAQELMRSAFPDFEVRELNREYLVAGVLGARLLSAMSVSNREGATFHAVSELFVLPTKRFSFLVGLTGTSDPAHRPESDFKAIVRSIRI